MALWTLRVRNNWTPIAVMDPKELNCDIDPLITYYPITFLHFILYIGSANRKINVNESEPFKLVYTVVDGSNSPTHLFP